MKQTLLALCAVSLFWGVAVAQTVIVGGSVNNGDFEAAVLAPFAPEGGSISTGEIPDHTTGTLAGHCAKIDLTANNGAGQWKGVLGDIRFDIDSTQAGLPTRASLWVYVPSSATFGTAFNNGINSVGLEVRQYPGIEGSDNPAFVSGWMSGLRTDPTNLATAVRDEWFRIQTPSIALRSETTSINSGGAVATAREVNGKSGIGQSDPNAAQPADWMAAGYSGFIYIDDYSITQTAPPPPGVGILGDVNNGNVSSGELEPFVEADYLSLSSDFDHTGDSAAQSLKIDLSVQTANQWKGIFPDNANPNIDVRPNQNVKTAAWLYLPSSTVLGDPALRARNAAVVIDAVDTTNTSLSVLDGTGIFNDITGLATDEWTRLEASGMVPEGTDNIRTLWFVTSADDPAAEGYVGSIYLDDMEFTARDPATFEVLVGPGVNNGDMEAAELAPFINGTISTAQNHTSGGSQSMEIDLQSNNDEGQWKGIMEVTSIDVIQQNETFDMSAWVYVPSTAQLGAGSNTTSFAFGFRALYDGGFDFGDTAGGNLKNAAKDEWVKYELLGATFPDFGNGPFTAVTTESTFIERIVEPNGVDGETVATPSDWAAAGYSGSIFVDDFFFAVHRPPEGIFVTDVTANADGSVTLTFTSTVESVDVYVNRNPEVDPSTGAFTVDTEDVTSPWTDTNASGGKTLYQLREFVE